MESVNILKGYDKVDEQASDSDRNRRIRKAKLGIIVSSVVLVTLIAGSVIAMLILDRDESTPNSSDSISAGRIESIRTVCSVTRFPDSCFNSISSAGTEGSAKLDPESILALSLRVCVSELRNLSSLPKALISRSNDPRTRAALDDCAGLFDDALNQLNETASAMDVGPDVKALTEAKIADMKTWISAAITDQETCLDGLEEMGSKVVDEVRAKVHDSNVYMSNSLAILSNIEPLLSKFGLTMH